MLCVLVENSSHNSPGFDFSNLDLVENCLPMSEITTSLHPSYITGKTVLMEYDVTHSQRTLGTLF